MNGFENIPEGLGDFDRINDELKGSSDREAVIVGGSLLEFALEQCIAARLRAPVDKKEREYLFGDRGCFGTFGSNQRGLLFASDWGRNKTRPRPCAPDT